MESESLKRKAIFRVLYYVRRDKVNLSSGRLSYKSFQEIRVHSINTLS